MRRAGARNTTRQNLAALRHIASQRLGVFVVNVVNAVGAEAARLAGAHEAASAGAATPFFTTRLFSFAAHLFLLLVFANRQGRFVVARVASAGAGTHTRGAAGAEFLGALQVFVYANGDVTDDRVIDAHAAFDFGDLRTRAFDRQHDVVTFVEFADGISEAAAAHTIDIGDLRALMGEHVTQLRDERFNVALFGVGSDDK